MSFASEEEIQAHVATHLMNEGSNHECHLCSHVYFDSPLKLQCHLIEHTFEGCSAFTCYMCSTTWTTAKKLQEHMVEHGLHSRPYDCTQCHLKFFFRAELENHIFTHEDIKKAIIETLSPSYGDIPAPKETNLSLNQDTDPKLMTMMMTTTTPRKFPNSTSSSGGSSGDNKNKHSTISQRPKKFFYRSDDSDEETESVVIKKEDNNKMSECERSRFSGSKCDGITSTTGTASPQSESESLEEKPKPTFRLCPEGNTETSDSGN